MASKLTREIVKNVPSAFTCSVLSMHSDDNAMSGTHWMRARAAIFSRTPLMWTLTGAASRRLRLLLAVSLGPA